ncbi:MAG TPA: o-succinylbenzoate synthase [Bryobacteraceae bacterium]|nr:o-succinylbenzoate synthase [Bryobacteraceae bacterium]
MIVRKVTLTHVRVPLVEPFRISSGAVSEKDGIVVRVETEDLVGFGESSPMSGTFYSSDTPESCWQELSEQLAPALAGKSFDNGRAAAEWIGALPGSNFAKTGIETAFWDIEARRQGKPLYELLGGTAKPVESGLAVGLYDDLDDMLRAIGKYLPHGYKRVKIKIERGRDVELVRAVRGAFGDIPLFVDANGAYDLTDIEVFRKLDDFGLMMYEQPFPGPMLRELAELQSKVRTPVCLDESLESVDDLRQAIRLGSLKIANIKIQRVGGFGNAMAVYEMCRQHGIPVWVGTMPELGIGQAQGMALGTLSHCTFPTDVEASTRWFRDDIIQPFLEVQDGCLHPPASPGLGFEVNESKLEKYKVAAKTIEL